MRDAERRPGTAGDAPVSPSSPGAGLSVSCKRAAAGRLGRRRSIVPRPASPASGRDSERVPESYVLPTTCQAARGGVREVAKASGSGEVGVPPPPRRPLFQVLRRPARRRPQAGAVDPGRRERAGRAASVVAPVTARKARPTKPADRAVAGRLPPGGAAARWRRARLGPRRGRRGRRAGPSAIPAIPRRFKERRLDLALDAAADDAVRGWSLRWGRLAIARRAFVLQVRQADLLRERAEDQSLREIEVRPQRGRILDRKGHELASTAELDSVSCNPRVLLSVAGRRQAAGGGAAPRPAARSSGPSSAPARRAATSPGSSAPSRPRRAPACAPWRLPGVRLTREPARIYPHKDLGAAVLGHANIDGMGIEGVELAFDDQLRGTAGRVRGVKDGSGRDLLHRRPRRPARAPPARTWCSTLDTYLMHVTQTALAAAVKTWNAKGGAAIMMDPRTGEVLALASVPTYDANHPGDAVARGLTRNRAITDALRARLDPEDHHARRHAGRRPGDARRPVRLPVGPAALHRAHAHPRRPPRGGAHRRRGVPALEQHRHRQDRPPAGQAAAARGAAALRLRPADRHRAARASAPAWCTRSSQWGDIHLANIAFGQGLTRDAAADGGGHRRHRQRRHLQAAAPGARA